MQPLIIRGQGGRFVVPDLSANIMINEPIASFTKKIG